MHVERWELFRPVFMHLKPWCNGLGGWVAGTPTQCICVSAAFYAAETHAFGLHFMHLKQCTRVSRQTSVSPAFHAPQTRVFRLQNMHLKRCTAEWGSSANTSACVSPAFHACETTTCVSPAFHAPQMGVGREVQGTEQVLPATPDAGDGGREAHILQGFRVVHGSHAPCQSSRPRSGASVIWG